LLLITASAMGDLSMPRGNCWSTDEETWNMYCQVQIILQGFQISNTLMGGGRHCDVSSSTDRPLSIIRYICCPYWVGNFKEIFSNIKWVQRVWAHAPLGWHIREIHFIHKWCLLYRYTQCTVNQMDMSYMAGSLTLFSVVHT